jgi:hypothetical protein
MNPKIKKNKTVSVILNHKSKRVRIQIKKLTANSMN